MIFVKTLAIRRNVPPAPRATGPRTPARKPPIPPFIAVLTGITDAMVATAPRLEAALPAFLEFARGAVLVAHNAPFDIGFLKAACAENGLAWPPAASVDTAVLA